MPPQQKMRATNNRHIPPEIIEEILSNLPVKSLLRFSSVSESWNSMISKSAFVERYRGHRRIFFQLSDDTIYGSIPISPASSSSSSWMIRPCIEAFCDELWLVSTESSLYLCNPSTRKRRKLPPSSLAPCLGKANFGLGYERVADDYKILKIPLAFTDGGCAELYSMRSDSWRKIEPSPRLKYLCEQARIYNLSQPKHRVFASGNLHWMHYTGSGYAGFPAIISFDLSRETFGEVALPSYPQTRRPRSLPKLSVLRGKLCVTVNYYNCGDEWYERGEGEIVVIYEPYTVFRACEIWMMEEYGDAESWTKSFSIEFRNSKCVSAHHGFDIRFGLIPLYLYENGEILVRAPHEFGTRIFVYKDEKTTPRLVQECRCRIVDDILNVDSLVAL